MKLFILGLPHTITTPKFWSRCGFTEKVRNLCAMMKSEGHEVYHLGVEGSKAECTENVSVIRAPEWEKFFGKCTDPNDALFQRIDGPFQEYHWRYAKNCSIEIERRCDRDFEAIVCMAGGVSQWWAASRSHQYAVECGIGYEQCYADYRIYESYAWMHAHLGRDGLLKTPRWYWRCIPNAFDVTQFTFNEKRGENLLYFGRLNEMKGLQIAVDTAKLAGRKITICGYGNPAQFLQQHVTCLPPASAEERRKLYSECYAVICPPLYVEPFGRATIEAALSGAPVIACDVGGYTETVVHGVTGYRCSNIDHFAWAANNCHKIEPQACRDWAVNNFSTQRIAPMYSEYFESILRHPQGGWSAPNPQRTQLDWIKRSYPSI